MSNDLLKEAIAEAKHVREVAIEQAKDRLAEEFLPTIRTMMASRLKEEEEGKLDDEEGENKDGDEGMKEGEKPKDGDEGMKEGEKPKDDEEGGEETLDLEAIIKELESELNEEEGDMDDEEKIQKVEKMEPEDDGVGEGRMSITKEELDAYISEILDEMAKDDGEKADDKEKLPAESAKVKQLESENAELKEQRDAAYSTIHVLREKIQEAVLINNKLLYSGKLFRAFNLTESQKIKVLEAFDRATTPREAKLTYTNFATAMSETKKKPIRKLSESTASKPSGASTKIVKDEGIQRLQYLAGITK